MAGRTLTDIADSLPEFERDRLTAAEVCIDEALSIMDRHGGDKASPEYRMFKSASELLDVVLELADGAQARYDRLKRVSDELDATFPWKTS